MVELPEEEAILSLQDFRAVAYTFALDVQLRDALYHLGPLSTRRLNFRKFQSSFKGYAIGRPLSDGNITDLPVWQSKLFLRFAPRADSQVELLRSGRQPMELLHTSAADIAVIHQVDPNSRMAFCLILDDSNHGEIRIESLVRDESLQDMLFVPEISDNALQSLRLFGFCLQHNLFKACLTSWVKQLDSLEDITELIVRTLNLSKCNCD